MLCWAVIMQPLISVPRRQRQVDLCLRSAWSTELVPGHPELQRETLSRTKTKTRGVFYVFILNTVLRKQHVKESWRDFRSLKITHREKPLICAFFCKMTFHSFLFLQPGGLGRWLHVLTTVRSLFTK